MEASVPKSIEVELPPSGERRLPFISVVFSFWNEEENIPELLRRTRAAFQQSIDRNLCRGYELIFVNDSSTDRSEILLREEFAKKGDIRILNMSRNFGVSPCVLAGMHYASGDAVIYLDADLQDPPELIPDLLQMWQSEPDVDVVHTTRTKREGESRIKLLITRIGYAILKKTSSINLPTETGDYKLVSKRAVQHLIAFKEKNPYMRGLVCWIGFKQKTVFYQREPRFSGETKFHIFGPRVIGNFLNSAVISFSDVPLKLSILFGGVSSIAAMLYMMWVIIERLRDHTVPGFAATNIIILMLGGLLLLSNGITGLYIASIFLESKGRPNFIVRDTFGFNPDAKNDAI